MYLAIVRGSTLNYNGYDVVETIYETRALAFASRCLCFADRLRGRTARKTDAPPVSLSRRDAVALSAAATALRSECRPTATDDESAGGNDAAADRGHGEQTDQGRFALRDS